MVELRYNDKFDEKHHPMNDEHRAIAERLATLFKTEDYKHVDVVWYYESTLFGSVIFAVCTPKSLMSVASVYADWGKFDVARLKELLNVPGFRWVRCDYSGEYDIQNGFSKVVLRFGV